jgi:hypothetical protein
VIRVFSLYTWIAARALPGNVLSFSKIQEEELNIS